MSTGDPMVAAKIDQVPGILQELGLDAWLIFVRESQGVHDPSLDLVVGTNVTWHSAFILTRRGDRIAVVGSLDKANIDAQGHYRTIFTYVGGVSETLRSVIEELNPKRIAINHSTSDPAADGLTHGMYLTLTKILEGTPYADRLESASRLVAALRGRKTPEEQARIRAACDATVTILDRVTPRLKAGLTERQVAALILEEMESIGGLEPAWDRDQCPAVFTGPSSAGAHASPTDRAIEPGHIMNVDFGVRKDGYCSDLQRTWYFLRPGESAAPEAVRKGFETILGAIREAAAAIRPGRPAVEIDDVARRHVTSRGYADYPHGTGHQIGRVAHDGGAGILPRWERYGETPFLPLEVDQCFTLEPRLSVEGHGIATCEDIVVVTPEGAVFLSRPQEELTLVR